MSRAPYLAVLLFGVSLSLRGQGVTTDSPFLPVGGAGGETRGAPAASPTGIEFCGVMQRGGEPWFCLYETSSAKGRWLPLNREVDGWVVRSYEPERRELVFESQGQSVTLALKKARLDGGGGAMASSAGSLPPGVVPPVAAPTAADEAARLKTVADEIKRRRALRAAALNGQSQPPPPPPPAPGTAP